MSDYIIKYKVEEMTKENAELKCEMLRLKRPTLNNIENECGDVKQPIRPVSMFETREGIKSDIIQNVPVRNILLINIKIEVKILHKFTFGNDYRF